MDEAVAQAEALTKAWAQWPQARRAAYCQGLVERYGTGAAVVQRCFDDCAVKKEAKGHDK